MYLRRDTQLYSRNMNSRCKPYVYILLLLLLFVLDPGSLSRLTLYSIVSLVEHQGTVEISSPYPKFVLTGVTKY